VVPARGEYEHAWAALRRRNFVVRLVVLSFLPGIALLILVTNCAYGDVPDHFGSWVGGSWLTAFFCAFIYRRSFRCPRCREPFFARSSFHSGDLCSRCDLPLWANVGLILRS
jgi:hypothetical protein